MKPIIRSLPTEYDIKNWVDGIVTPENADQEARLLAKLLLTVTNADDDDLYPLATTAAKHAFTKTLAFQAAFEQFADLPDTTSPRLKPETSLQEFENEQ